MAVTSVKSVQNFDEIVQEKSRNGSLVVVHFWTSWSEQCKHISEVLGLLANESSNASVGFVEVEAEDIPQLSQKYKISAVPTCILIKNQKEVARVNGANVPELNKKLKEHSQPGLVIPVFEEKPKQDLNARLKSLINQSPCMVFMKGNPANVACGFSKKLMEILNEQNTEFSTFDILSDEDVRQGLKTYSDWPTYPQVYVNGELIGGLDIILEMKESGELESMLPKKETTEERLKKLTNKAPVMIFMKGNPDSPKCGFSKVLVEILRETGVKYETFDILQDENVRQTLKTYSNWPTYPQVYVNGDLIGGLDIVKELQAAGELLATLNAKQ